MKKTKKVKKTKKSKPVKKVKPAKKTASASGPIAKAEAHFGAILEKQIKRVESIKKAEDWIDYTKVKPLIIGVMGGDGIGPHITDEAQRVLEHLLVNEVAQKKVVFRVIEGLTIEKRVKEMRAIPVSTLAEVLNNAFEKSDKKAKLLNNLKSLIRKFPSKMGKAVAGKAVSG